MKTSVTQQDVDGAIAQTAFWRCGDKTTVGFARLHNGFEIVATSACVDASKYDEKIGEEYAMKRIKEKIWELLGFQLQCDLFASKLKSTGPTEG